MAVLTVQSKAVRTWVKHKKSDEDINIVSLHRLVNDIVLVLRVDADQVAAEPEAVGVGFTPVSQHVLSFGLRLKTMFLQLSCVII